ncbi:MAG TPA: GNAT family N-acetyltransferase [Bacteroidia bacterium]|nr:GNAT family N-acetyltransferase [Bacteroidia bacterium]
MKDPNILNETSIRPLQPGDLEKVAFLFDQYRVFYGEVSDYNSALEFLSERMHENESVVFIAVEPNGVFSGFVQLYPIFSSVKLKRQWLLNDLFVAENFRNNGLGRKLIDACKNFCRETNSGGLLLETAKTNISANNLYLNTGFKVQYEQNFYFWDINGR